MAGRSQYALSTFGHSWSFVLINKPVSFLNDRGQTLRGILTSPEEKIGGGCHVVVMPNCGLMGAEGDFRSHYRIGKRLVESGYHVLRFSPSGLGFSDGEIEACRTKDLFGRIQTGLFVRDVEAAIVFLKSMVSFETLTLLGVCGGGITVLLAAAEIDCVDAVIPISCPVVLDSDSAKYSSRISRKKADVILGGYKSKLFAPSSWVRLFTFKSDLPAIRKALVGKFRKKIHYADSDSKVGFSYNTEFDVSINSVIKSGRKCLFVFGGQDHFYFEFQEIFLERFYKNPSATPFDVHLIEDGNHMLTWIEMQHMAIEVILSWLKDTVASCSL